MRQCILDGNSRKRAGVIIGSARLPRVRLLRIASRPRPLTPESIGPRVNERERNVGTGGPYPAVAEGDVAAMTRRTQRNGGGALAACIDAGQRAVALVESPNGAPARGEKTRIGSGSDRCRGSPGRGIDARHLRSSACVTQTVVPLNAGL